MAEQITPAARALHQQARLDQNAQAVLQRLDRGRSAGPEQGQIKFTADGGGELQDVPRRPQVLETALERLAQGDRNAGQRRAVIEIPDPIALHQAGFHQHAGEFLDEQRHTIGAGHDVLDHVGRQATRCQHVAHHQSGLG